MGRNKKIKRTRALKECLVCNRKMMMDRDKEVCLACRIEEIEALESETLGEIADRMILNAARRTSKKRTRGGGSWDGVKQPYTQVD